jgi:uncharacterized membrane protein YeiB
MLLLIALANAANVVFAGTPFDPQSTGIERIYNFFMYALVNAHAYPVFAVMFGYGLVQLTTRQRAAGASAKAARSVLLRRNTWLIAFGFVHAALLYYGDFLGAYGIVGIAATLLLLNRGDKVHRFVLWVWGVIALESVVIGVMIAVGYHGGTSGVPISKTDSLGASDYLTGIGDRLMEWPLHTASVAPFILIVWLGIWAARRRILENPEQHVRLLRWTAVGGLGLAIAGALPIALISAGVLHVDDSTASLMAMLGEQTGMFGGPGYVAVFGLIAMHLQRRQLGVVAGSLRALGQRSLSGYLFQSVMWMILLAPYTLALGTKFGSPTLTAGAVAALVWLASVVLAKQLDRRGSTGPAEKVLRRLTYGRR